MQAQCGAPAFLYTDCHGTLLQAESSRVHLSLHFLPGEHVEGVEDFVKRGPSGGTDFGFQWSFSSAMRPSEFRICKLRPENIDGCFSCARAFHLVFAFALFCCWEERPHVADQHWQRQGGPRQADVTEGKGVNACYLLRLLHSSFKQRGTWIVIGRCA